MSLWVQLLGSARVVVDERTGVDLRPTMRDKALAHLAYVHDWVARDRLAFLFWPDTDDTTARHNVRQLLKRIRRLGWLTDLEVTDDRVRWAVSTDVAGLRDAIDRGDVDALPDDADLLIGFERGSTVEYERWLLDERRAVRDAWRSARLMAAREAGKAGDPAHGSDLLAPLLAGDDADRALLPYMQLRARAGDPDAALAAFDRVAARLSDELGVPPQRDAAELADRLRRGGAAADGPNPVASAGTGPSEDAGQLRVIGRDGEVADVAALLARPSCRLVTLLGPGGIGKSSLARLVCDRLGASFAAGACFVPLEAVTDPQDVAHAIAATLRVLLDGRLDPVQQVIDAMDGRELLLGLDNLEHLPDAWLAVAALLAGCPRLRVVTTSRERGRLDDEWVYDVPGLDEATAADLFEQRARRLAPEVAIDPDDARAVARAVGGSPLGIELAAPWIRVLSPAEIAAEIERDATILADGSRDAPPRHRSLDAAMAHSWQLATPEEREAIEALSVFAAPYPLDLAVEVGDVETIVLRRLADQSLVHRRDDGRYASHPLVRQYAAARLAGDDHRRQQVRQRHARAVLERQIDASGPADPSLLEDTVRAWRDVVERGDLELMARAATAVVDLLDAAGRYQTGLRLVRDALRALGRTPAPPSAAIAALRRGESVLLYRLGRHAEAAPAAEEALRAAREADDARLVVRAALARGWACKWTDGDPAQYAATNEVLPVAESLGDQRLLAEVYNGLGCSAASLEVCRQHLLDGLRHAPASADVLRIVLTNNLGLVTWALGDVAAGLDRLEESLQFAREAGRTSWTAHALANVAFLEAERGDLAFARERADEAERLLGAREDVDTRIHVSIIAGEIRRLAGDADGARARMREVLRIAQDLRNEAFLLRALRLHGQLLVDTGEVDDGLTVLAFVLARTDRRGDFTCEILNPRIWEECTASIAVDRVEAARSRSAAVALDELTANVLAES